MIRATSEMPLVVRVGARCPVGLSSLEVAMCVRACKLEPRSSALLDRNGRAVGTARARWLDDELTGFDRLVALAAPALAEAARGLPAAAPLVLALAAPGRADDDARYGGEIVAALAKASGVDVEVGCSEVVRSGNAGFAGALQSAARKLAAGTPAVLVGGVDGFNHPDVLRWLDDERRLHAPGTDDGIVPSEGAAFVLLSTAAALPSIASAPAIASLQHVGVGIETSADGDEAPSSGRAITDELRRGLPFAERHGPIGWILSDVNGEHHRVREWSIAEVRLGEALRAAHHDQLVGELGDVGAAIGPLSLAIACTWLAVGCAPARSALLTLASDGPERAVVVVEGAS
jgi:3-oxoacyl-[acyl-carrier-protein] synthase-1